MFIKFPTSKPLIPLGYIELSPNEIINTNCLICPSKLKDSSSFKKFRSDSKSLGKGYRNNDGLHPDSVVIRQKHQHELNIAYFPCDKETYLLIRRYYTTGENNKPIWCYYPNITVSLPTAIAESTFIYCEESIMCSCIGMSPYPSMGVERLLDISVVCNYLGIKLPQFSPQHFEFTFTAKPFSMQL